MSVLAGVGGAMSDSWVFDSNFSDGHMISPPPVSWGIIEDIPGCSEFGTQHSYA